MADHDDAHAGLVHALDLDVHLGHQRTGGVVHRQAAGFRLLAHRLRHAVRRVDQGGAGRHILQLLDEDGALVAQVVDHEAVVHHLVADIDRGAVDFQRALDDGDGTVDAGAETARVGQHDGLRHRISFSS
ncbi:hypothetical protein D3C85_1470970 [compost metagenome]